MHPPTTGRRGQKQSVAHKLIENNRHTEHINKFYSLSDTMTALSACKARVTFLAPATNDQPRTVLGQSLQTSAWSLPLDGREPEAPAVDAISDDVRSIPSTGLQRTPSALDLHLPFGLALSSPAVFPRRHSISHVPTGKWTQYVYCLQAHTV